MRIDGSAEGISDDLLGQELESFMYSLLYHMRTYRVPKREASRWTETIIFEVSTCYSMGQR